MEMEERLESTIDVTDCEDNSSDIFSFLDFVGGGGGGAGGSDIDKTSPELLFANLRLSFLVENPEKRFRYVLRNQLLLNHFFFLHTAYNKSCRVFSCLTLRLEVSRMMAMTMVV